MRSETAPLWVDLRLHDVTAHDQISQTFPLLICILQAIKYWRWERPGNEAGPVPGSLLKIRGRRERGTKAKLGDCKRQNTGT